MQYDIARDTRCKPADGARCTPNATWPTTTVATAIQQPPTATAPFGLSGGDIILTLAVWVLIIWAIAKGVAWIRNR